MNDNFWQAFFVALPATIASIGTLVFALRSGRHIQEIKHATNGMKDALVAATEKEALARGKEEGKDEEQAHPT